jgi:hypothetical protein
MGTGTPAWSLGFGRPVTRAILGETFNVTVPVRLESSEEIADDCLAADVFFGDDKVAAQAVTVALLPGQGTDRTVRVSTTSLINEPVVTLYLAAGCKAKVTRKFVAFADPPMSYAAPVVSEPAPTPAPVASAARVAPRSGLSATPVPGDSVGQPQSRSERRAAARQRAASATSESTAPVGVAAKTPPAVREAGPARSKDRAALSARLDPRPAKAPAEGARLVLDPVEVDAVVAPALTMSSSMGAVVDLDSPEARDRRAAAAALWAAMNASPEQLARDRQRMQELEQRLAKLQQDATAAREQVLAMESRVREAEGARLGHPLVMGLGGAVLLLGGALGFVIWRQRKLDAQAAWWNEGSNDGTPPADGGEASEVDLSASSAGLAEPVLDRTAAEFVPVVVPTQPSVDPGADQGNRATAAAPRVMPAGMVPAKTPTPPVIQRPSLIKSESQEAVREITVEELIDLEQQAEFFVVLGQDDAAIELLESHVHNTSGASPLPYLKLLEIYQRLGRRGEYEQVQEEFNGRFNAYAPSWDADLQHGHALEDYPGVIERLQQLWSQPAQAMEVLEKSLTRPDDTVETFDLPAYRELLFLYAVARDLSERDAQERAPVDLLQQEASNLMSGGAEVVDSVASSFEPLMATRPVKASPDVRPSLSIDLSLDDPASGHVPLADEVSVHIDLPDMGEPSATVAAVRGSSARAQVGNEIDFEHDDVPSTRKG